ncbi:hypothetical protein M2142_001942, partial [Fusobacterium sp. PH5-29]
KKNIKIKLESLIILAFNQIYSSQTVKVRL